MDLCTVTHVIAARQRSDLGALGALGPTVVPRAGGSELFAARAPASPH
jgi:hypothetical protein